MTADARPTSSGRSACTEDSSTAHQRDHLTAPPNDYSVSTELSLSLTGFPPLRVSVEDRGLEDDARPVPVGRRSGRHPRDRPGTHRATPRPGDAMTDGPLQTALRGRAPAALRLLETSWPALLVGAACTGIAVSTWVRPPPALAAAAAAMALSAGLVKDDMPRLALAAVGARLRRPLVGDDAERRARAERPFCPDGRHRLRPGGRHRAGWEHAVRRAHAGRGASLRAQHPSRASDARAPSGPRAAAGGRPRGARAAGRAAWARDRLRRARMARASRRARRAARRAGLARRRPAGRDRWRRRSAARARGEDAGPGYGGRAAPAARRDRPGRDSGLDPELRDAFQASGLTHLLAVSGQNVAIVAFGVVLAARILGFGRLVGEALAILVVLAYALAVGWQPSVVRAAVAGVLASLAWIVARPRDRWHALAVGALILLAWMPRSALEPGFQLSFAAVAAIFVVVPRLSGVPDAYPINRRALGDPRRGRSMRPRHGADRLAPLRPRRRSGPCLRTSPRSRRCRRSSRCRWRQRRSNPCCRAWRRRSPGSRAGARGGWRSSRGSSPAGRRRRCRRRRSIVAAALAVGAVVVLRRLPRYRRREAVVALVSLALVATTVACSLRPSPSWTPPRGLRVTFLDVGQGDSALVEAPGGAVLVDEGPPEADVAGQLRRLGVRSLAAIVLTHPQRDHIGGAARVLDRLSVGRRRRPGHRGAVARPRRRRSQRPADTASRSSSSTRARSSGSASCGVRDPVARRPGASERGPEPARGRRARELRRRRTSS